MKRRTLYYSLSAHPLLIWSELTFKTGEMMLASAQVIGHRTNRMALAGPTPNTRDQREFALMGQEKIVVAAEWAQAMALSMIRLNQQVGALAFKQMLIGATAMMALASSRTTRQSVARQARFVRDTMDNSAVATSQISASAARLVNKGLKPIHSRAKRNAKRLAKTLAGWGRVSRAGYRSPGRTMVLRPLFLAGVGRAFCRDTCC
jgi:hypothetical protein